MRVDARHRAGGDQPRGRALDGPGEVTEHHAGRTAGVLDHARFCHHGRDLGEPADHPRPADDPGEPVGVVDAVLQ